MWGRLKEHPAQAAATFGLLGGGINALAMIVTGLAYVGRAGERYSPLNHWVSELGETGVSELALVFNAGLFVGSACLIVYMLGLAMIMRGRPAGPFAVVGVVCGVSGMLVGVFPIGNLSLHTMFAQAFFGTGGVAVLLFLLVALFDPQRVFPRVLAIPSGATVAAFVIFLAQVAISSQDPAFSFAAPEPSTRPDFWPVAAYEWLTVFFFLCWILIVAQYLRRHLRQAV